MWGTSKLQPSYPGFQRKEKEKEKYGRRSIGERQEKCANKDVRSSDYVHGAVASTDCS